MKACRNQQTIKETFQQLLNLVNDLDKDETRIMKPGLDEEINAIFDLLRKDTLSRAEIKNVKAVVLLYARTNGVRDAVCYLSRRM